MNSSDTGVCLICLETIKKDEQPELTGNDLIRNFYGEDICGWTSVCKLHPTTHVMCHACASNFLRQTNLRQCPACNGHLSPVAQVCKDLTQSRHKSRKLQQQRSRAKEKIVSELNVLKELVKSDNVTRPLQHVTISPSSSTENISRRVRSARIHTVTTSVQNIDDDMQMSWTRKSDRSPVRSILTLSGPWPVAMTSYEWNAIASDSLGVDVQAVETDDELVFDVLRSRINRVVNETKFELRSESSTR